MVTALLSGRVCVCVYACACIRGKREGEGGVSVAVHFPGSADGRG